jgi:hypothetical protein
MELSMAAHKQVTAGTAGHVGEGDAGGKVHDAVVLLIRCWAVLDGRPANGCTRACLRCWPAWIVTAT